jgi:Na+/proline symporter
MEKAQSFTLVALALYAIAMAIIGSVSYKMSKTLDGFLIGGRKRGA